MNNVIEKVNIEQIELIAQEKCDDNKKLEKNSENSNYFSESKKINKNTLINIVKKKIILIILI